MCSRLLFVAGDSTSWATRADADLVARELTARDFHVEQIALTRRGMGDGVNIPQRWPFDPRAIARLRNTIAALQPNAIHAWDRSAARHVAAALLAVKNRPPLFVQSPWGDADDPIDSPPWPMRAAELLWRRVAAKVVASNDAIAEIMRGDCRLRGKVVVVPSAIEFAPDTGPPRSAVAKNFGLDPAARWIVAAGAMRAAANFKQLVWAFDLLRIVEDDIRLVIVGDGPESSRTALAQFIAGCRSDHVVSLVSASPADRRSLFAHAAQLWCAQTAPGLSTALIEAATLGVASIAVDTPVNRTLILTNQTGLLYRSDDRRALAVAARRLLNEPELVAPFQSAARDHIAKQFSPAAAGKQLARLYRAPR